ncbi:hypothetical protein JZ751_001426, partial [Albula glossodonta]
MEQPAAVPFTAYQRISEGLTDLKSHVEVLLPCLERLESTDCASEASASAAAGLSTHFPKIACAERTSEM